LLHSELYHHDYLIYIGQFRDALTNLNQSLKQNASEPYLSKYEIAGRQGLIHAEIGNVERGEILLLQAIDLYGASKQSQFADLCSLKRALATLYYHNKQYNKMAIVMEEMFQIAEQNDIYDEFGYLLVISSKLAIVRDASELALDQLHRALRIATDYNLHKLRAEAYIGLAFTSYDISDLDNAANYANVALSIAVDNKLIVQQMYAHTMLAIIKMLNSEFTASLSHVREASSLQTQSGYHWLSNCLFEITSELMDGR
jgi:tetratricopeptide (TPR) repeat protein